MKTKFHFADRYNETELLAKNCVDEAMYIKELIEEVNKLTKLVESQKPICPNCHTEMELIYYHGYYDNFSCWTCQCDLDEDQVKKIIYGSYVGY
jgi:tRNA(Ile2) C34 agmatinyltransferase TiaS